MLFLSSSKKKEKKATHHRARAAVEQGPEERPVADRPRLFPPPPPPPPCRASSWTPSSCSSPARLLHFRFLLLRCRFLLLLLLRSSCRSCFGSLDVTPVDRPTPLRPRPRKGSDLRRRPGAGGDGGGRGERVEGRPELREALQGPQGLSRPAAPPQGRYQAVTGQGQVLQGDVGGRGREELQGAGDRVALRPGDRLEHERVEPRPRRRRCFCPGRVSGCSAAAAAPFSFLLGLAGRRRRRGGGGGGRGRRRSSCCSCGKKAPRGGILE